MDTAMDNDSFIDNDDNDNKTTTTTSPKSLQQQQSPPIQQQKPIKTTQREFHQDCMNRLRQYYAPGTFYGSPALFVYLRKRL
jgi:hypothetical protein